MSVRWAGKKQLGPERTVGWLITRTESSWQGTGFL